MTVRARLILASTSRYRQELLARLGVAFTSEAPQFDERKSDPQFPGLPDEEFALGLARGKALEVRARHRDAYVLAADQIAVVADPRRLLHKPKTVEAAIDQLMMLSGRVHVLTTGVVLLDPAGRVAHAVDRQCMTMRAFDRPEATRYVERHRPLDSVGAYRIEDAGITLFESIDGSDHTGIIGLPLLAVCRLLRSAGLLAS